jgi:hypothetical protein
MTTDLADGKVAWLSMLGRSKTHTMAHWSSALPLAPGVPWLLGRWPSFHDLDADPPFSEGAGRGQNPHAKFWAMSSVRKLLKVPPSSSLELYPLKLWQEGWRGLACYDGDRLRRSATMVNMGSDANWEILLEALSSPKATSSGIETLIRRLKGAQYGLPDARYGVDNHGGMSGMELDKMFDTASLWHDWKDDPTVMGKVWGQCRRFEDHLQSVAATLGPHQAVLIKGDRSQVLAFCYNDGQREPQYGTWPGWGLAGCLDGKIRTLTTLKEEL